jgi:RNA polymerase sigma-70 factor, ECF subfamily
MDENAINDSDLRALMTRYQRAESAALEELIRRLSPPLLRYFRTSRVDGAAAEDMLQECWIRIHRSRHSYRASEPVLPWIYAIARYTRLDAYRKRRRLERREVLMAALPEVARETRPDAAQEDFEELIARLPDSQREVLVMLKVSGMSLEEVARATSSTVGAVKQKAHRAYVALRRAMGLDT